MDYWNKTEFAVSMFKKDGSSESFNCFSLQRAFNKVFAKLAFDLPIGFFEGFKTFVKDEKLVLIYFIEGKASEYELNLDMKDINQYLNKFCQAENVEYKYIHIY